MKITRIRTGPGVFNIEVNGKEYEAHAYRQTLNRQGVVLTHSEIGQPVVFLQDPDNEESAMGQVEDAIDSRELASLQKTWAEGRMKDGWHDVDLKVTS
tara:strand:- start:144 stop:437 length:294 start_codon:yes stop_codon:yes gene_type:complete